MHRVIRDHLEEVLAQTPGADLTRQNVAGEHLENCEECRIEVEQLRGQSGLLRTLRPPADVEPRAGFYARVMERIENEGPVSIWYVFSESAFGRRIAVASMALALAIGVYLFNAERPETAVATHSVEFAPGQIPGEDQPGLVLNGSDGRPDRDAVLVNLVTYREQ